MSKFRKLITIFGFLLLAICSLPGSKAAIAEEIVIPNYWDRHERFSKPELATLPRLRFLTTTDFPPFNFIDRKKRLTGFHVDLAREICAELDILNRCEIQAVPWEDLKGALENGEGEAILAGLSVTPETRKIFDFSYPYLRIPARFVVRSESAMEPPVYEALFRRKTGVIESSNHAAYFARAFENRRAVPFANREEALLALKRGDIDAVFSDALSLSFWLTSAASGDCCIFLDGAFQSEKYFGSGMSVAVAKGRQDLRDAMNFALSRINRDGTFAELYLRYFPVGLY